MDIRGSSISFNVLPQCFKQAFIRGASSGLTSGYTAAKTVPFGPSWITHARYLFNTATNLQIKGAEWEQSDIEKVKSDVTMILKEKMGEAREQVKKDPTFALSFAVSSPIGYIVGRFF